MKKPFDWRAIMNDRIPLDESRRPFGTRNTNRLTKDPNISMKISKFFQEALHRVLLEDKEVHYASGLSRWISLFVEVIIPL